MPKPKSQSQKGDLLVFLQHENQNCPPSLSQKGMLHSAVKSQLLDILEQGTYKANEQQNADTVIMDDTTLINANSSRAAKRSDGYGPGVAVPLIESYIWKYHRYVVFDIYHQDSLKS